MNAIVYAGANISDIDYRSQHFVFEIVVVFSLFLFLFRTYFILHLPLTISNSYFISISLPKQKIPTRGSYQYD